MTIRSKKPIRKRPSIHDSNIRMTEAIQCRLLEDIQKLPDSPRVKYLQEQLMSKFVSKDTDPAPVRRQRAINKWLAVENDNAATYDRLLNTHEDFNILPRVSWSRFVQWCQDCIADLIGETVPIEALIGAFSGGASTSRPRTESLPAQKYLGQADTTAAALPWFELLLTEVPGWASFRDDIQINVVPGNVLFTVPKNTTIDRCACKEPDLNMFMQKGVGNFFRHRLRSVGINLNDQTRNQNLARIGSIDGSLATLDLSSASDRLSFGLVELLLPLNWFILLRDLRSPITLIDGDEHVNEMFSSMGNGFTFELESLIFYVIARACAYFRGISGVISVYGDDIICPSKLAADLWFVLPYLGFEVNTSKSFAEGPFRESCGGHYYNGDDITPFYLRSPIEKLTDVIRIANQLRRWASLGSSCSILDPSVEELWLYLKAQVPKSLWGGHELGSIYQLVSPDFPKSRLIARSRNKRHDAGGYIQWLNTTWVRDAVPSEAIVTSSSVLSGLTYRMRPAGNSSWRFGGPVWFSEL